MSFPSLLLWACMVPIIGGSVYGLLCLLCVMRFRWLASQPRLVPTGPWPPVTILKPVHGLEKHLFANLRKACLQDYPTYQVVFSVQDADDPALPLLRGLQQEFGPERVSVAIGRHQVGTNGKINNLIGGLAHARHDVLVISDSDIALRPDFLKAIVAPLDNPNVGFVNTLFRATAAETWFEKMELHTFNSDFFPNLVFAHISGSAKFCIGSSVAFRRSTLQEIGGLEVLEDYLVEDYEMGRRIWETGKQMAVAPYIVDTVVDLKTPGQWWHHTVYWDQNSCVVRPWALLATLTIRPVPFAVLFAFIRLGDILSLTVLAAVLLVRLGTTAAILEWGLRDREGLKSLWLLPFRDLAGFISLFLGYTRRTTVWRGKEFVLTREGRLVARENPPCGNSSSPETTSVLPSR